MTSATRRRSALIVLAVLLFVVVLASTGTGAVGITPSQVLAILAYQINLPLPPTLVVPFEQQQVAVLVAIRIPRVLMGAMIGAALAVSGAAMQGMFRNPLADPGLIGVSSGAALAAVATIVLGVSFADTLYKQLGPFTLPVAAFVGAVGATVIIYRLANVNGRTIVATMLLAGIAMNALLGAGTGFLTFIATDAQLRNITFWTLGSIGGATWRSVAAIAPFVFVAIMLMPRLARALNAMALGEAEARHLGFDVERTKRWVVMLVSLAVGAAVALAGIIGFIGLIVPHLLRLLMGPDHRGVLPGAALLGAALLLAADLIARTIVAPAELPIGIVTATLGAPFFLWLLLRDRRRSVL
ncbi:MAG: FecCD family ABC transporter permease [Thermoflexales bacterium]